MIPVRLDFPLPTNADYVEEYPVLDGESIVDLTGYSIKAEIKSAYDSATVLKTLSTVGSATLEGFYLIEPSNGIFQIRIAKETADILYDAVNPSSYTGQIIAVPYDAVFTLPNGDDEQWFYGYIILNKGITNG